VKHRARPIEIERLVAASDEFCQLEAEYVERGFGRAGARAWSCRDRTVTLRLVWRKRGAALSTVTCVMRGLPA
jgi:hypothetical protein